MLPRTLPADLPEAERARWRLVRLDTHEELPGLILAADCEAGTAKTRVRGPDQKQDDGTVKPTFAEHEHNLGAGGLAIIGR